MDLKQLVMLAFQVSILCTVFGFGLKSSIDDLVSLVRRPGLLLRSLIAVLVVMPVLAVTLARLFDFRPVAEIALIALAISPVPPLLPKKASTAGGNRSYGLGLMVVLALLAIVTVPLSAEILQRVFARPLGASPSSIARVVLMMAGLPLVAGIVVRATLPALAARLEPVVTTVAKVLLPVAILALLAGTWRAVWAAIGGGTIVATVIFVVAGLLIGHFFGRPDPDDSTVLALSSACRHPAIALSIASANFPDEHFGGTILLYLIINAIVGILYLAWLRRHRPEVSVE